MNSDRLFAVRALVADLMKGRGYRAPIGDDQSLFVSGLLDSMMAVDLILRLEAQFGVDFSRLDFDVSLIDTVQAISDLTIGAAVA